MSTAASFAFVNGFALSWSSAGYDGDRPIARNGAVLLLLLAPRLLHQSADRRLPGCFRPSSVPLPIGSADATRSTPAVKSP